MFCPLQLVYKQKSKFNEKTLGLWAKVAQPERKAVSTWILLMVEWSARKCCFLEDVCFSSKSQWMLVVVWENTA